MIVILILATSGDLGPKADFERGCTNFVAEIRCKSHLVEARASASLPPGLLRAIIAVESNGNPLAYNKRTGDYGLYQINHRTARAYGYKPEQMYQPQLGHKVAVKLLLDIRKRFKHERRWECRYNVGWRLKAGTGRACTIYYNKLLKAGYKPQKEKFYVESQLVAQD